MIRCSAADLGGAAPGRRRYRDLFERGELTTGRVVALKEQATGIWSTQVIAEYEAPDGSTHRVATTVGTSVAEHWTKGAEVDVLVDPDAPSRAAVVYR